MTVGRRILRRVIFPFTHNHLSVLMGKAEGRPKPSLISLRHSVGREPQSQSRALHTVLGGCVLRRDPSQGTGLRRAGVPWLAPLHAVLGHCGRIGRGLLSRALLALHGG